MLACILSYFTNAPREPKATLESEQDHAIEVIWRMPQGSRRRPWKVSKTMQLKLFYERSKGAEGDLGNLNIIISIEISSSFC